MNQKTVTNNVSNKCPGSQQQQQQQQQQQTKKKSDMVYRIEDIVYSDQDTMPDMSSRGSLEGDFLQLIVVRANSNENIDVSSISSEIKSLNSNFKILSAPHNICIQTGAQISRALHGERAHVHVCYNLGELKNEKFPFLTQADGKDLKIKLTQTKSRIAADKNESSEEMFKRIEMSLRDIKTGEENIAIVIVCTCQVSDVIYEVLLKNKRKSSAKTLTHEVYVIKDKAWTLSNTK